MASSMHSDVYFRIARLLDDLLKKFVPGQTASERDELLRYVSRILSSRNSFESASTKTLTPIDGDNTELLRILYKTLSNNDHTRNPSELSMKKEKCDELIGLLTRSPSLKYPASVITLLCDLSQIPTEAIRKNQINLNPSKLELDAVNLSSLIKPTKSIFQQQKDSTTSSNQEVSDENVRIHENKTEHVPSKADRDKEDKAKSIQKLLVRDVLYAFQGIDGHLIKYNDSEMEFKIAKVESIKSSTKTLALQLCELGFLFRHISDYVSSFSSSSVAQKTSNFYGLVSLSFSSVIKEELTEYYRIIASLEAQLKDFSDQHNRNEGLTLRRLKVWSQEPMKTLRLLAEVIDSVKGLKGGALASAIHAHTMNGDAFVRKKIERIMERVAAPIFEHIRHWVMHGELRDVYGEFFVAPDDTVPPERLWFEKYTLNTSMVPGFIGKELAAKILLVGKSINFMKYCCKEADWRSAEAKDEDEDHNAVTISEKDGFHYKPAYDDVGTNLRAATLLEDVDVVAKKTNKRLCRILFEDYNLLRHCRALKQYLLLGQGDTIQYLMDLLSKYLPKPASQIYRHHLNQQLETAVRASNAQYDADEVLQRLDVRILEASPGDCGWDVFTLDYHLTPPLNAVVTSDSMQKYLEIFTFLWKLKRVEYSLSSIWKQHMIAEHSVRDLASIRSVLQRSHVLRSEMVHFTSNLHNYIMFEVLETSWEQLVSNLNAAGDLDEIVKAHDDYLDNIILKSLLGLKNSSENASDFVSPTSLPSPTFVEPDAGLLKYKLYALFDIIIRFCSLQERLYTKILEHVHKMDVMQQKIYERTQAGKWGIDETMNEVEQEEDLKAEQRLINEEYTNLIQNINVEYRNHFQGFLHNLQTASELENLRFLRFRLDFNLFYES